MSCILLNFRRSCGQVCVDEVLSRVKLRTSGVLREDSALKSTHGPALFQHKDDIRVRGDIRGQGDIQISLNYAICSTPAN